MKTVILTAAQRDSLIAMARHYYPQYPFIRYGKNWDSDELWFSNYRYGETYREDKPADNAEIHWFQFCVHHLMKEMVNILDFEKFLNQCVVTHNKNIVDFLFDEFTTKVIPNESIYK